MDDGYDSDTLSDYFYVQMVSEEDTNQDDTKCVFSENLVKSSKWIVSLVVNGTIVHFKLDTGAKVYIRDVKALK